jgi:hypothetical protein
MIATIATNLLTGLSLIPQDSFVSSGVLCGAFGISGCFNRTNSQVWVGYPDNVNHHGALFLCRHPRMALEHLPDDRLVRAAGSGGNFILRLECPETRSWRLAAHRGGRDLVLRHDDVEDRTRTYSKATAIHDAEL